MQIRVFYCDSPKIASLLTSEQGLCPWRSWRLCLHTSVVGSRTAPAMLGIPMKKFLCTTSLIIIQHIQTLVTLSRLGGRPLPTLMVWKGRVRSLVGRERAVAGLVRS